VWPKHSHDFTRKHGVSGHSANKLWCCIEECTVCLCRLVCVCLYIYLYIYPGSNSLIVSDLIFEKQIVGNLVYRHVTSRSTQNNTTKENADTHSCTKRNSKQQSHLTDPVPYKLMPVATRSCGCNYLHETVSFWRRRYLLRYWRSTRPSEEPKCISVLN
jgi:hypothetical protein